MEFLSFDDYWSPLLGGLTPTLAFAAALDAKTGGALAAALRAGLPEARPDGSFVLGALAWAIKGTMSTD